jgi:hypothetical protein
VKQELEAIDAVTVADLKQVLTRYPLLSSTTLAIGPAADLQAPS